MNNEEFEDYCLRREIQNKRMRCECEQWFKSAFFEAAYPDINAVELMQEIKHKRERGLPLFSPQDKDGNAITQTELYRKRHKNEPRRKTRQGEN